MEVNNFEIGDAFVITKRSVVEDTFALRTVISDQELGAEDKEPGLGTNDDSTPSGREQDTLQCT